MLEDTEDQMGRVFLEYGTPLMAVSSLRYLGRTLSSTDENWPAVERNFQRARGKWGRLTKILGREGADKRTAGRLYVTVMQAVLLFGSEKWVLTPGLENSLEEFHHWEVRRMTGMGPKH